MGNSKTFQLVSSLRHSWERITSVIFSRPVITISLDGLQTTRMQHRVSIIPKESISIDVTMVRRNYVATRRQQMITASYMVTTGTESTQRIPTLYHPIPNQKPHCRTQRIMLVGVERKCENSTMLIQTTVTASAIPNRLMY